VVLRWSGESQIQTQMELVAQDQVQKGFVILFNFVDSFDDKLQKAQSPT